MKKLFVNERGIRPGRVILALAVVVLIIALIWASMRIYDWRDAYETAKRASTQQSVQTSEVPEKTSPPKPAATRTKGEGKKKTRPAPSIVPVADAGLSPNMFASKEACRAARDSKSFRYYTPKFFSRRGENPVDGVSVVRATLEGDACVLMLTVSGMQWVVQEDGTAFRFPAANGVISSPIPLARDDCGNRVDDIDPKGPMAPVTKAAPKVLVTLKATPSKVPSGGETALEWKAENAKSCTASNAWSGEKNVVGGVEVIKNLVGVNKLFVITCFGFGGDQAVAYAPVEVEFKVSETKPEPTVVETITYIRRDRPVRRYVRDFYDYGEPVRYVEQYPRYIDGGYSNGGNLVIAPVFTRGGDRTRTVTITNPMPGTPSPTVVPTNVTRTRPIGGGGSGASNITRTRP